MFYEELRFKIKILVIKNINADIFIKFPLAHIYFLYVLV